jgi:two-component system nitrate/nitrite response regulator NarL
MERRACATVVVGRSALFREGLIRILRAANFQISSSIPSIDSFAFDSLTAQHPVLFILDASDDQDAIIGQIEFIKKLHSESRIVVLDGNFQLSRVVSAYRAGASAYFVKVATSAVFVKFLELIILGETILPSAFLPFVLDHEAGDQNSVSRLVDIVSHDDEADACGIDRAKSEGSPSTEFNSMRQLSARETVILRCIIEGGSNKAIARKIAISEATVKVHVKSILRKIRVHSRTQAAIWGMTSGLSVLAMDSGLNTFTRMTPQSPASQHAISTLAPNVVPELPQVVKTGALRKDGCEAPTTIACPRLEPRRSTKPVNGQVRK